MSSPTCVCICALPGDGTVHRLRRGGYDGQDGGYRSLRLACWWLFLSSSYDNTQLIEVFATWSLIAVIRLVLANFTSFNLLRYMIATCHYLIPTCGTFSFHVTCYLGCLCHQKAYLQAQVWMSTFETLSFVLFTLQTCRSEGALRHLT